jgi:plasmid stabilization system protein ParE
VSRAIILLPEAVIDADHAFKWYDRQSKGLGDDFLANLERAYKLIAENPAHYPVRFDSFRRILVKRFPYAIYFDYDDNTVFVHYVFHCAQNPDKLMIRL